MVGLAGDWQKASKSLHEDRRCRFGCVAGDLQATVKLGY